SRRQHWDVSLIAQALALPFEPHPYDHLPLATVVEFGLNCPLDHLQDDIQRLSHPESNVNKGFCAHLFRLSEARGRPSQRDWAPTSGRLRPATDIQNLLTGMSIEVYLGVYDPTGTIPAGLWLVTASGVTPIPPTDAPAEIVEVPEPQTENMHLDS